jgi:putative tryptophan/tyrosine transport system substrate-binding protein
MQRRKFITLLGGAAAAWPLAARAQQQGERVRRVGVLVSGLAADDPEWQVRGTAFAQRLQERGWSVGRNLRIDTRWSLADPDRLNRHAAELVALPPDVLVAGGGQAVAALQRATRTLPIVFANVTDPVGGGYVASLARPGGNATGFMSSEFSFSGKLLELLKQVAPRVTRVAVFRNPGVGAGSSQFAAIQTVAPSFGVEVTPLGLRDADEIERGITAFVRGPNDGLIVAAGGVTQAQRDAIITLAARHRLPAAYPFRGFVTEGGLISYSSDRVEQYHAAAAYVDRILKGEKPADLPVQAPTKYQTVLNMKTAKALGLQVPDIVLVRADEVIE